MIDKDKYCERCIYKPTCDLTGADVKYCFVRYLLANVLGELNKHKKVKKKRYEKIIEQILGADDRAKAICQLYLHELNPLDSKAYYCSGQYCNKYNFDCDECMYAYLTEDVEDEDT